MQHRRRLAAFRVVPAAVEAGSCDPNRDGGGQTPSPILRDDVKASTGENLMRRIVRLPLAPVHRRSLLGFVGLALAGPVLADAPPRVGEVEALNGTAFARRGGLLRLARASAILLDDRLADSMGERGRCRLPTIRRRCHEGPVAPECHGPITRSSRAGLEYRAIPVPLRRRSGYSRKSVGRCASCRPDLRHVVIRLILVSVMRLAPRGLIPEATGKELR